MSSDAADEVVRIALNGTEVAIRLAGSGVKNLASLLIAWSKNEKKPFGKTSMTRLLESGEELTVLSLDRDTYLKFRHLARRKLLYAPFVNTKEDRGTVDIVLSKKSMPIADYLLSRIESREEAPEQTASPQKKTEAPSPSRSADVPGRSREAQSAPLGQTQPGLRESVEQKLEANRIYLNSQAGKRKTRNKDKSRSTAR